MSQSKVIEENIRLHEEEANDYEEDNPDIFNQWESERITSNLEEIIDNIETDSSSTRALDAGCGTGNVLRKLMEHFDNVIGIDISEDMLEVARKETKDEGGYQLIQGKVSHLPFPKNHFDLVTAYSLFHHLPEFENPISEISRVLKPGGVFYLDHEPINREKIPVKFYIKFCEFLNGESYEGLPPYEETDGLDREHCDYQIHHGDNKGLPKSDIVDKCKEEGFEVLTEEKYLSYGSDQLNPLHPILKSLLENEWLLIAKK